ncbi:hypothetical protein KKE60_07060 [Patescibacteria group bacterium]|nr:hypothetical protein [Patescibacteria group bacterium]
MSKPDYSTYEERAKKLIDILIIEAEKSLDKLNQEFKRNPISVGVDNEIRKLGWITQEAIRANYIISDIKAGPPISKYRKWFGANQKKDIDLT